MESRRLLWQTADEENVRNEELLRQFYFGLTNSDAGILAVSRYAQSCNVIATIDCHVVPKAIVYFYRQNYLLPFSAPDDENDIAVA